MKIMKTKIILCALFIFFLTIKAFAGVENKCFSTTINYQNIYVCFDTVRASVYCNDVFLTSVPWHNDHKGYVFINGILGKFVLVWNNRELIYIQPNGLILQGMLDY